MIIRNLQRFARCLDVSPSVASALEAKKPVVALESTIITHGMPYPHNEQTALEVEKIVRNQNATPATIGIIKGRLKVGLTTEEIHFLASTENSKDVVKTSRRDLPYVLSQGLSGGTTVSGTMVAAHAVGIKVFVTGGIGGVHRGGETSLDVSADLMELGRTPVAVVCSGVKSILDIPRTLEYLETQGVCVAVYGETKEFPAFYCRGSQCYAPYNVTNPAQAAALVRSTHQLGLSSGILLAVPVPEEHQLINEVVMESAIQSALKMAVKKNITGKAVTPFLLQQLAAITGGQSLQTNIALIKNNALVGAKIAVALAESSRQVERKKQEDSPTETEPAIVFATPRAAKLHPVVIGGSILDCVVNVQEPFKVEGRTLDGRIRQSGGGVGRNIADALGKLDLSPRLVSAVGDDQYGRFLLDQTISHLNHSGVLVSTELQTASYTVLLDQRGEFRMGVGDMDVHTLITPDHISKHLQDSSAVIMDGNIPSTSIQFVLEYCSKYGIPVIFEPTDAAKATIPFQYDSWKCLRLITPNIKELRKIASFIGLDVGTNDDSSTSLEEVVSMATPLAEHINTVLVTLGALGLVMVGRIEPGAPVTARYYAEAPLDSVLSVSGAGDCLAAGVISGILTGQDEAGCVATGFAAAQDSLLCYSAVPPQFTSAPRPVQYSLVDSSLKRSLL